MSGPENQANETSAKLLASGNVARALLRARRDDWIISRLNRVHAVRMIPIPERVITKRCLASDAPLR
jgi:hypothetical protein